MNRIMVTRFTKSSRLGAAASTVYITDEYFHL
jgi:hypothetical protein